MKEKIPCAYCDGKAILQKEQKEVLFRKDAFFVLVHYYQCINCKEKFTNLETDNISLLQLHNLYREKYEIPFPEELMEMRSRYGLSAAKMSEILGLGANGYSNYESGEMPTPAIGNLLSAAVNPSTFLQFVNKSTAHFSDKNLIRLQDRLHQLVQDANKPLSDIQLLGIHAKPDQFTGFRKMNPEKIASLIVHLIKHGKSQFNDKLKINKLLFFSDFLHFKHHGYSISGLSYRAIQYGPVPTRYDFLYSFLENEAYISSKFIPLPNGAVREIFLVNEKKLSPVFTQEEIQTLAIITKKFYHTPTWNIVEMSHKEKAWKEMESKPSCISYQQYAFRLQTV